VIGNDYRIKLVAVSPLGNSIASALANEFNEAAEPVASCGAGQLVSCLFVLTSSCWRSRACCFAQLAKREGTSTWSAAVEAKANVRADKQPYALRNCPEAHMSGCLSPAAHREPRQSLHVLVHDGAFGMRLPALDPLGAVRAGRGCACRLRCSRRRRRPGSAGGLANAIYGSVVIVGVATFISTPIGILAGIYLAEYGKDGDREPHAVHQRHPAVRAVDRDRLFVYTST
jgi:hypothetical protein